MSTGLNQCCSNEAPLEELLSSKAGFSAHPDAHLYVFSPSPWLAAVVLRQQFDYLISKYLGNKKSLWSGNAVLAVPSKHLQGWEACAFQNIVAANFFVCVHIFVVVFLYVYQDF